MTATATATVDWPAAREAVATVAPRVTALLRSVEHPTAPALADWDLTDVAIHLSHALDGVAAMANGGGSVLTDLWGLGDLTSALVEGETTRDLAEIADRIEASVESFLRGMETAKDDGVRAWLVEGTAVRLSTLTCHFLNELVVHGRDVAMAEGVPWKVDRRYAALVLTGFIFPAFGQLGPAIVDQQAAAGVRASFDVRLRGGGGVVMRFDNGNLTMEPCSSGSVDCHLSVDPEAFLLVGWGRISQWPAIARGKLFAWGRKPWLGVRLRSLLRNP